MQGSLFIADPVYQYVIMNFSSPGLMAIPLIRLLMMVILMIAGNPVTGGGPPKKVAQAPRMTIIIGDDYHFPPYSFLDQNKQPAGFNIDIARAAAKAMGIEVEFKLDQWDKTRTSLENGELDAISGMFFSRERDRSYSFSTKHSVSTGDIFSKKDINLFNLQQLAGKVVLVQKADIIGEYLKSLKLGIILVEVSSVTDALHLVDNGLYDYAGILKLPGMYAIKQNNLKNIKAQGLQFSPHDYCFAVKKGNEDILYLLNAGLHVLKANGEYQDIHDRWLGVFEDKTIFSFIREYGLLLSIIVLIIFALVVTSITLKYLINKKTRELQILNESLVVSNSEIKRKNQLLATSQAELELRLEEIEKQGEIIKFKQNFLANMSHEIRTPLTGILGMIDIMAQSPLNEEQAEYINILKHSGENLREIINQVLDYSKIEAGKVQLKMKDFVFHDLVTQARNLFHSLAGNRLTFLSDVDTDIPVMIRADKNRLLQMINNLISNSVKFTHEGSITLKAELFKKSRNKLLIRILVTDTGFGITEEKQKVLFRPFAQIHESDHREFEGTGLGLSICKELARLHGGMVGLESKYGQGSTFWFTFIAEITNEFPSDISQQETSDHPSKGKLSILLAEDKVVNQKVIKLLLASAGHQVVVADNGQNVLDLYQPQTFDLILMDIQMPVMDGIRATSELRSKFENLPPIVGLSANAFEGDREKYISLGLDEYITKPFKIEDFEEVVERVLNITPLNNRV
jgi:signal transduction histidine kinase/ActR/RegA family two-component response regulator